jgi:transcriptional regulator NrdR family protein
MKCRECGAWSLVKQTRTNPDGNLIRRRTCGNNHSFSTIEQVAVLKPVAGTNIRKLKAVREPA